MSEEKRGKKVIMADIAAALGVSNVTVSNALSGKKGVGSELRAQIIRTAREMGYNYGGHAQGDGLDKKRDVGLLVAERYMQTTPSFYWTIYQKISAEFKNRDYFSILEMLSRDDESRHVLPRMISEKRVGGLIILGQLDKGYLEEVCKIDIPIIFLDFYEKDMEFDAITSDNYFDMYRLTMHLLKCGHRRLMFVGSINTTASIQDRFLGFAKALLNYGIFVTADMVIPDRDEYGNLIDIALPENLPSAFVCNCDEVAASLIEKLRAQNLDVPQDVSVSGFDNYARGSHSAHKITTVEVDVAALAESAVSGLIRKMNMPAHRLGYVRIGGRIIKGETVDTPRRIY